MLIALFDIGKCQSLWILNVILRLLIFFTLNEMRLGVVMDRYSWVIVVFMFELYSVSEVRVMVHSSSLFVVLLFVFLFSSILASFVGDKRLMIGLGLHGSDLSFLVVHNLNCITIYKNLPYLKNVEK